MTDTSSNVSIQRRVLVCVCGMSPAVITETLYVLMHQDPPFVPDEVHV
ncbi:hypothetical protein [Caldimonas tepidiphila]|nr:hypothetical protein [Caldimonas tepidiphila]